MEPVRLHLENFTSYRDEALDLTGVRLAAVVGPNGAGKSSLIDAITWALWGEGSKGTARALDNYVRRGAQECRVTVDFLLHGQMYRVIRQRVPARGKTVLELYRRGESGWEAMSGKTVAETQQRINDLLRMDYRTFTASSVILQGQADSLTADMTDQERKEVLARILGLDLWDRLQEVARERARQARAEAKALTESLSRLEEQAARRPELEVAITRQTAALETAQASVQEAAARVAECEAQARQRPLLEQRLRDLEAQLAGRQQDRQRVEADLAVARRELEEQRALLSRRERIEAELAEAAPAAEAARQRAEELQAQVTELEARVRAGAQAEQTLRDLEAQITARRREMEETAAEGRQVRAALEQQQALLRQASEIRAAAAEAAELEAGVASLDELRQRWAEVDLRARDLERQAAAWERDNEREIERLQAAIADREAQAALLGSVPCAGTELQTRCQLLAAAVEAAGELCELRQRLAEIKQTKNPHVDEWQAALRERDALGYDAQEHAQVRERLASVRPLAQQLPSVEAAEQRQKELLDRLDSLRRRFKTLEEETERLKERAAELWASLSALDRDRSALNGLRAKAQAARQAADEARERMARLQQAREETIAQEEQAHRRIADLEQRILDRTERIAAIDSEIAGLQARQAEVEQALSASAGLVQQLEQTQAILADARRREAEARETLGRLRAELDQVSAAEQEAADIRKRVAQAERRALVYEVLDQAAGKRGGVPALIIEAAVPQIESIANDLLRRMAGGRLQVRLDTQTETKSGTVAEVLRITVLDGGEERPYQTYSGAERFMIDLALRIALSRFLAHRAGAEIKLLVLDEGLGALDAANRRQVVAALQEAARGFSKVLVVTHIAELQDALPQRIEVERRPDGSRVRVV